MKDYIIAIIIVAVVMVVAFFVYEYVVAPAYVPVSNQSEEGIAPPSVNVPQIPHDTIPDSPEGKG